MESFSYKPDVIDLIKEHDLTQKELIEAIGDYIAKRKVNEKEQIQSFIRKADENLIEYYKDIYDLESEEVWSQLRLLHFVNATIVRKLLKNGYKIEVISKEDTNQHLCTKHIISNKKEEGQVINYPNVIYDMIVNEVEDKVNQTILLYLPEVIDPNNDQHISIFTVMNFR